MKPFNLEEALAGKPVVTRDGNAVEILAHGLNNPDYTIAAIIKYESGMERTLSYGSKGEFLIGVKSSNDLMMKAVTRRDTVTLYKNEYTGQRGVRLGEVVLASEKLLATFPVEWEE